MSLLSSDLAGPYHFRVADRLKIEDNVINPTLHVLTFGKFHLSSWLHQHPHCLFGSHNRSNSAAVARTREMAIVKLIISLSQVKV
jgi:hypothetical protein